MSKSVWTIVSLGLLAACANHGGARPADASSLPSDGGGAAIPAAESKPECLQCVLEDLREAAHKDQVVVTARYLGLEGRWLDGRPTRRRCTRDEEVMGTARFALLGEHPHGARPEIVVASRKAMAYGFNRGIGG